jgi:hypothetical protein
MWSPPPRHVLLQLAPVQLEYETPRVTTRTRPCSPQDEWRDLKWEFLTGLALFAGGRLTSGEVDLRLNKASPTSQCGVTQRFLIRRQWRKN